MGWGSEDGQWQKRPSADLSMGLEGRVGEAEGVSCTDKLCTPCN
jgi:hypothetical protein